MGLRLTQSPGLPEDFREGLNNAKDSGIGFPSNLLLIRDDRADVIDDHPMRQWI